MTSLRLTAALSAALSQTQEAASALEAAAGKGGFFGAMIALSNTLVESWLAFLDWFGRLWGPVLRPVFAPVNALLASVYQPWAQIFALSLFIGTMVWVCFFIKPEMLNSGRENRALWTDLRLWTVLSMLPHLFVYVYFM